MALSPCRTLQIVIYELKNVCPVVSTLNQIDLF